MDYNSMPSRVSNLATEIESKKILQDEQVKAALDSSKRLLYYVSGGKENANMGINDKVRPEDQDLRGWFTERYGDYLAHLTSDTECMKSNSDRVSQIISHFNETPFGYSLRTGAVNEYHIGRIVSYAKMVNTHRREARAYSKDLAVLCAQLLFSGEPPNNNIFDILHSSIRNWYTMQEVEVKIPFEQIIASGSIFNQATTAYNHTTYCAEIIFALFDMHTFSMESGKWENFPVGENYMSPKDVRDLIGSLDGYGKRSIDEANRRIAALNDEYRSQGARATALAAEGWNTKPLYTEEIRAIWKGLPFQAGVVKTIWGEAEAKGLKIGDELPKGLPLSYSAAIWNDSKAASTNDYWVNYDTWLSAAQKSQAAYDEMNGLIAIRNSDQESGVTTSDFHKVPAKSLLKQLSSVTDGDNTFDYSSQWLKYVYERARKAWGLSYIAYSAGGPMPGLAMPAMPGQVVESTGVGSFSISKTILFYARSLQGVTPNAYWSNALSHRIVLKEGNGYTDVFLYSANIKTGGVGSTYTDIAKLRGDKDSAAALIGTYLPDVPLYKPGTNVSITPQMEDSFATKISNDPKLKAWLRTSMKSGFNYAYVIRSAWVPKYNIGKFTLSRSPTHLLGTRSNSPYDGLAPQFSVPALDPFANSHLDWLRATTWSKSNFKGVSTFKPSMETLRFDPFGNRQNLPEFYEGRNALTATEMHCVAFPKRAAESIAKFMESVPALLSEHLNANTNLPNSPWYEAQRSLTREAFFGDLERLKREHPSYLRRAAGVDRSEWGFREDEFYSTYDYVRTFLLNRTESLFIQDPASAATKAYNKRKQKNFGKGVGQPNLYNTTLFYDEQDFGPAYKSYMGLLGAIAYFNSFEMLTDSPSNRTLAPWAKPFAGEVNAIISSVLGSSTPQTIFTTQINDTADVSNMHKTLEGLGAFDEMLEMPVYDLKEFHAVWQPLTSTGSPLMDSPFLSNGFLNVPRGGLKTSIFPGLKGTYGDVFYHTMMETCVLNPVISATTNGYVYSSVRVPVNTRGLSSKVYGLRPGTTYSFSQGSNKADMSRMFTSGSGRLSYTTMAGGAGLLFAGALGIAMYKNIANENAWKDKRFQISND